MGKDQITPSPPKAYKGPEPSADMKLSWFKARARCVRDQYGIKLTAAYEIVAKECGYSSYQNYLDGGHQLIAPGTKRPSLRKAKTDKLVEKMVLRRTRHHIKPPTGGVADTPAAAKNDTLSSDEALLRQRQRDELCLQHRQRPRYRGWRRHVEAEATNQWGDEHRSPEAALDPKMKPINNIAARVVYTPGKD